MKLFVETSEGQVCIQLVKRDGKYYVRSCPYTMYFPTEAQRFVRMTLTKIAYDHWNESKEEINEAVAENMKGLKVYKEKESMKMDEWLKMKAIVQRNWFNPEFRKEVEAKIRERNPGVEIAWSGE
ncbi:MAG: hypothetical protein QXP38_06770 [Nitrososphaerota archaeon]